MVHVADMELMVHWGQLAGEVPCLAMAGEERMGRMVPGVHWASRVRMAALGPCLGMG